MRVTYAKFVLMDANSVVPMRHVLNARDKSDGNWSTPLVSVGRAILIMGHLALAVLLSLKIVSFVSLLRCVRVVKRDSF